MTTSTLAKFGNSLKFDPRDSGAKVHYGPVYGPAGFVAFRDYANAKISTNGITWADHTVNIGLDDIRSLKVINNQYVAIGYIVYNTKYYMGISTSTDGLTWTARRTNIGGTTGETFPYFTDMVYANGFYLAVNGTNQVYKSTDLTTWADPLTVGSAGTVWKAINTYLGFNNSIWFAVGGKTNNGLSYAARGNSTATTWTDFHIFATGSASTIQSIATDNTTIVYAGSNGRIGVYDIATGVWLTRTISTNNFTDVKKANSQWVVYSDTVIVQSIDPWFNITNQTNPITQSVTTQMGVGYQYDQNPVTRQIAYGASVWISGSEISTNGIAWAGFDYVLPGQQPYLDYTDSRNWGDWKTIDFWTYIEDNSPSFCVLPIVSQSNFSISSGWQLYFESQNNNTTLYFSASNGGDSYLAEAANIPVKTWLHIRLVLKDNVGAIYLNGQRLLTNNGLILNNVIVSQNYNTGTFDAPSSWPNLGSLTIGRIWNGFESDYPRPISYWIDEFMVNSEVLNDPSLTTIPVPTRPWQNTENTMLLLHFDENYLDDNSAPNTLSADISALTSMTTVANAYHVHDVSPAMSSSTQMTILAGKLLDAQVQCDTVSTEMIIATRGIFEIAEFNINSNISVQSNRTRQSSADISTVSNITAQGKLIRPGVAGFSSTSSLSATASEIVDMIVFEPVTSSMTIQIDKIKFAAADLILTTALSADADLIDDGRIISSITSSLECSVNVHYSATADLHVLTDLMAITNGVNAHVNMTSEFTMRASAKITLLDLGISYMIPYDDRAYIIEREVREAMIEYEDRTDLIGRL